MIKRGARNSTGTPDRRLHVVGRLIEVSAAFGVEALQVVAALVTFKLVAEHLGPARYGAYTVIYVISGLVMCWVWACATAAMVQLVLQQQRTVESAVAVARRRLLRWAAPGIVVGTVLAAAVIEPDIWWIALIVLATELLMTGFGEINVAVVFAVDGAVGASRLRGIIPVARTIGVVILALTGEVSLGTLAINNMVASALVLGLSFRAMRSAAAKFTEQRTPTTAGELNPLARLYGTTMATNAVQDQGDKFVLATFRTDAEVGVYAAAYRVVSLAFLPLHAVNIAAHRWFLARDDRQGTQLRRALRLTVPTVVYGLVAAAGLLLFRGFVERLAGPEYESAVTIVAWLSLFPLARGVADVPMMGLIGLGRNRARTWLGVAGVTVASGAYLALIPTWGWKGAVAGTYISEGFVIVFGWALLFVCQARSDSAAGESVDERPIEHLSDVERSLIDPGG